MILTISLSLLPEFELAGDRRKCGVNLEKSPRGKVSLSGQLRLLKVAWN